MQVYRETISNDIADRAVIFHETSLAKYADYF